jgi:hypothetical protein
MVFVSSTWTEGRMESRQLTDRDQQRSSSETYPFEPEEALVGADDALGVHAVRDLLPSGRDLGRAVGGEQGEQLLRLGVAEDRLDLRGARTAEKRQSSALGLGKRVSDEGSDAPA